MKKIRLITVVLGFAFVAKSQISIKTNLIHSVAIGRVLAFDLKLEKAAITGFTRLDIRHPEGITISGLETNQAQVLSSDSLTSLVWELSPTDTLLNLRLKLSPIAMPGKYPLVFMYHYQKEDVKIDFESHPFLVVAKDTSLPVFLSSSWESIRSLQEPAIPLPAVRAEKVIQKSPAEVEQQVAQLKRDSREAKKVGELEKERLTIKIDTLQKQLAALGDSSASAENAEKYTELKKSLNKAEEEMKVAERVLTLAKNLEAQANEIQRISNEQIAAATNKAKVTESTGKSSKQTEPRAAAVEVAVNAAASTENTAMNSPASKAPVLDKISENGIVYKVQIGSFAAEPDMEILKKAGNVVLLKENGLFKALTGSFDDLSSAAKYKAELSLQFPGCFVVGYRDGQRLR